jgi:hypothetical protein
VTATLDILTLDEAREAINVKDNTYDTRLTSMNTAVSLRFDVLCGPIVDRSVTERHDGGNFTILPRSKPIESITSLTEYVQTNAHVLTAETAGTVPPEAYLWESDLNVIYRRASGYDWVFWPSRRNIVLVMVCGRAATTALVPPRFKEAAAITLAHVWRAEMGSGNQTFGVETGTTFGPSFSIPNRARELVADEIAIPGIA